MIVSIKSLLPFWVFADLEIKHSVRFRATVRLLPYCSLRDLDPTTPHPCSLANQYLRRELCDEDMDFEPVCRGLRGNWSDLRKMEA